MIVLPGDRKGRPYANGFHWYAKFQFVAPMTEEKPEQKAPVFVSSLMLCGKMYCRRAVPLSPAVRIQSLRL